VLGTAMCDYHCPQEEIDEEEEGEGEGEVVAAPNSNYDSISRKYECLLPVCLVLVTECLLTKFLVTECLVPCPNA